MVKPIPKEIKEQILSRVREGKETVVNIAAQHGVKANTVYNWVSKSLNGINGETLAINRLKRENQRLKEIIGSLILAKELRGKSEKGKKY